MPEVSEVGKQRQHFTPVFCEAVILLRSIWPIHRAHSFSSLAFQRVQVIEKSKSNSKHARSVSKDQWFVSVLTNRWSFDTESNWFLHSPKMYIFFSYPAIRTPRYTVLQALRLWFGNPRNRSHLQVSDAFYSIKIEGNPIGPLVRIVFCKKDHWWLSEENRLHVVNMWPWVSTTGHTEVVKYSL